MTFFQIVILLLTNVDKIKDLIDLIGEIADGANERQFHSLSEEDRAFQVRALADELARRHPHLAAQLQAESRSLLDLVKIIIENGDDIMNLIDKILEIIEKFQGNPTSLSDLSRMSGTSMTPPAQGAGPGTVGTSDATGDVPGQQG